MYLFINTFNIKKIVLLMKCVLNSLLHTLKKKQAKYNAKI